ncbi:MAG: TraB/GumN family protein [Sphaerochaetaceae bacterium]|jgi:pheromone shutdown-related protein TraB|nr:TraB/GumN family protein [Sphaerochaetaceae bacterium]MDD2405271.1 TraB/GumN family protein [Sphaerochaetaceae bacterium]MDD4258427.1 TraB/GumN family protein [Sphaerochaetaceae bacterium]MDD4762930.1 TraB/GumN family protein [Sphaerochaetaceae bacterium]MDD4840434.1 TraB/GumN family protein [Sphaerochaetaceae bacterium]
MLSIEKINDTKQIITCSNGRRITLLGTAHVSQDSVNEVAATIEELQPDRVCVELDVGRYTSKTQNKGWEELNLKSVLKENKGFLMLANMALSSYQKRLGDQMGVKPGDEILGAISLANEKNIPVSFCDREIQITFKRAWRLSNFWNKMKLISVLISSIFSNEKISNEDIEKIKETDILQSMLEEMAQELPTIKKVLIDERDQYLATSIYQAEGQNIVAVVGAGHVPGLVAYMQQLDAKQTEPDTEEITYIPKASSAGKIFSWVIIIALLGIIALGFVRSGWEDGLMMFLYWFALNASLTGIAALISLAHPVTIIVSMLAAPVTALNPTIGVGMVAGIIEASVRKPRVKDFEHLTDDIQKFKGWFKNRIIHTLMIFMTTSIFASIGTFIAFPVLISKLNLS